MNVILVVLVMLCYAILGFGGDDGNVGLHFAIVRIGALAVPDNLNTNLRLKVFCWISKVCVENATISYNLTAPSQKISQSTSSNSKVWSREPNGFSKGGISIQNGNMFEYWSIRSNWNHFEIALNPYVYCRATPFIYQFHYQNNSLGVMHFVYKYVDSIASIQSITHYEWSERQGKLISRYIKGVNGGLSTPSGDCNSLPGVAHRPSRERVGPDSGFGRKPVSFDRGISGFIGSPRGLVSGTGGITRGERRPSSRKQGESDSADPNLVPEQSVGSDSVRTLSGARLYQSRTSGDFIWIVPTSAFALIWFGAFQLPYRTRARALSGGAMIVCGYGLLGYAMWAY